MVDVWVGRCGDYGWVRGGEGDHEADSMVFFGVGVCVCVFGE